MLARAVAVGYLQREPLGRGFQLCHRQFAAFAQVLFLQSPGHVLVGAPGGVPQSVEPADAHMFQADVFQCLLREMLATAVIADIRDPDAGLGLVMPALAVLCAERGGDGLARLDFQFLVVRFAAFGAWKVDDEALA